MDDAVAGVMTDSAEDQLVENIREFDRLLAAHDECQSTGEPRDLVVSDDIKFAKPDVDGGDAQRGGIELVQLPVPHDNEKGK